MMVQAEWSQRLLRKGVLVDETYRLFAGWNFDLSTEANLARGLGGRQATQGWEDEVVATVRRRLRDFDRIKSLIVLAQRGMPVSDWRHCLRLWVGATEEPFHLFATGWLFDERARGRSTIRTEDLFGVIDEAAANRARAATPISAHSRVRAARDLLKTATDLGMVEGGGPIRRYATIAMGDDVQVFYVHMIAELAGDPSRAPASPLWRLAFMAPQDVHLALLHLHQFRRLDYQIAGSLVQLTLPWPSALGYAMQYGS
jgi:hypothetical protein